jgi:hypothetical protein
LAGSWSSSGTPARGLLLVEALSQRWGHFGYDGGGKVVWALLEAAPVAPGVPAAGFIP